jgi:hypothetical protein
LAGIDNRTELAARTMVALKAVPVATANVEVGAFNQAATALLARANEWVKGHVDTSKMQLKPHDASKGNALREELNEYIEKLGRLRNHQFAGKAGPAVIKKLKDISTLLVGVELWLQLGL